ncbi:hypothetical protein [Segatella maculosa]|nr:hypothetical protein [Segatella maculosa]
MAEIGLLNGCEEIVGTHGSCVRPSKVSGQVNGANRLTSGQ